MTVRVCVRVCVCVCVCVCVRTSVTCDNTGPCWYKVKSNWANIANGSITIDLGGNEY